MERMQKSGMLGEALLATSQKHIYGDYFPHFHDFYEIEYVISGKGSATINGKAREYLPGTLCFLTPVDWHGVYGSDAEVYNIMFSEQLVDFWLLEPFLRLGAQKAVTLDAEDQNFIGQLCRELTQHREDTAYCTLLMSCLLRKMSQIFSVQEQLVPSDTLMQILSFVISHYKTPITLSSVSSAVGLTPSYVSVLFKKEMHIGFKAYLNSLRLEYAKKLLIGTQQSVRQICEDSGFEDVPNFIKRFKSYFGETPTEMRKRQQTSERA
jgi:AraC-like DNA-binding protein